MAFRSLQRRFKKGEAGFVLMEAVVAAGFSAFALSASLLILNRQTEMVQKARDMALIQAAVSEDINAIRHQARFWNWSNSYYRGATPSATIPDEMIYRPTAPQCSGLSTPGKFEQALFLFLMEYPAYIKGGIPISTRGPIAKTVPGYVISRNYAFPTAIPSSTTTSPTTPGDQRFNTLRVTYSVKSVKTNANGAITSSTTFPFEATRDILIPAQFSC
ncbi:MAG: hypothetical protein ACK6BG_11685 [Cyanobacteriota bacterium]